MGRPIGSVRIRGAVELRGAGPAAPIFLQALGDADSSASEAIDAALARTVLRGGERSGSDRYPTVRFRYVDLDGQDEQAVATFERRLRTAVSRRLGRPSGTDKHLDVGGWAASINAGRRRLAIGLRAQLSMSQLRRAAVAWLGGAPTGVSIDRTAEPDPREAAR